MSSAPREDLKKFLAGLELRYLADTESVDVEAEVTGVLDQLIAAHLEPRLPDPSGLCVMAIGGYGSRSMHPHSDVDVLFLLADPPEESLLNQLLTPLWDWPMRISHQVRTISDFGTFEAAQFESYTAFLSARHLAGSRALSDRLCLELLPELIGRHRDEFGMALLETKRSRYERFGGTVYQLEPDLKEAPGGIRDLQWVLWTGGLLSDETATDIRHLGRFHSRIRSLLHFASKRNQNRLSYEFQEEVAPRLGFRETGHGDAAENLMREYFMRANAIARAVAEREEKLGGGPRKVPFSGAISGPFDAVSAFESAHRDGGRLEWGVLAEVRGRLDDFRTDLAAYWPGQTVLRLMKERRGIYETLFSMHEVGLLGAIFPEFEEIRCRVIRDFFHRYTVDEHSLIAIRNIEELGSSPSTGSRASLSSLIEDLSHPELILLALLFHDIGKAHRHDVRNHVHPGVEGVRGILERLRLPEDQSDLVVFLIQNHLEMSKLILRRDFTDEDAQRQFADLVGSVERLRMLTLLTWADMKAVNPEVMTSWKEDLLFQLYVDTYNQLTHGMADDRYDLEPGMDPAIEAVTKHLAGRFSRDAVREFLAGFPRPYLRTTSKRKLASHLLLSEKLRSQSMAMHLDRMEGHYELLVMTADRPSLFTKIVGVLAHFGANIIRGQAFANRSGIVCDFIAFEDAMETFDKNPSEIERFESVLSDVIDGRMDLDALLRGKLSRAPVRAVRTAGPATVHFDNDFSRRCTILEIVAPDAVGLLYRVGKCLASHGCDIEVALISTEGARAIDVFYITREGAKLDDASEELLRQRLTDSLV